MLYDLLVAAFLGVVEGMTEFIPVSSTSHLLILSDLLDFKGPPGHMFEIFIQLGAILAVVVLYWQKLWSVACGLPRKDAAAWHFVGILAIGTLPALVAGALGRDFIKSVLYDSPLVIASALILGGIVILAMEQYLVKKAKDIGIQDIPLRTAFWVGCAQAVALIPGVSRSGATIMGCLALGISRKTAAEFSFFLALPVMSAGVAYDLYKGWATIDLVAHWPLMATGFVCAFVTAMAVIRIALAIIARYGFAPFAVYRIALGILLVCIYAIPSSP